MVIPGGLTGAESMSQDPHLHGLVNEYVNANKWVGMICAGSFLSHFAFFDLAADDDGYDRKHISKSCKPQKTTYHFPSGRHFRSRYHIRLF
jgi:hypothetical protein